jgi:hypothetical protein
MWEYFLPDLAFDVVKGLIAGAASLALQVVAPRSLRALKRYRARWLARKAARASSSESLPRTGRGAGTSSREENASKGTRAFSSEVDTGSREENASKQETRAPFRFNRNGKGSSLRSDSIGTEALEEQA